MLYELMRECRNYFPVPGAAKSGTFTIENGVVSGLDLLPGQYFIIEGSVFNDGLQRVNGDPMDDEIFTGRVIPLAVPRAFLDFADRVQGWIAKYGDSSPITSESFAGYSYSKSTGSNGKPMTWKEAFASDLWIWRKL